MEVLVQGHMCNAQYKHYIEYYKHSIWKEKVFVNENFLEETASIRKGLLQKAKELRSQNKVAKVVYDELIVSD